MILCEDCRFWEPKAKSKRKPVGFGGCRSFGFDSGYQAEELAEDQMLVENDEGWGFFTGPSFGCVHGRER